MNYDRIILELIGRVSTLEDQVERLNMLLSKENIERSDDEISSHFSSSNSSSRDTTKYLLDGIKHGKNRLVLAIIKKYVSIHPNISADELVSTFDKSLQGSLGVIRKLSEVKTAYADYERRFFCSNEEIINTASDRCVVCTQWGTSNIGNILIRAKQLGMQITVVK